MHLLTEPLKLTEIKQNHSHFFQKMVKIVVDLEENLLALDADLHADLEALLLENGSEQKNLWGANIYFEGPVFLEFNSLINIRPHQMNFSMDIQDEAVQKQVEKIVNHWVQK